MLTILMFSLLAGVHSQFGDQGDMPDVCVPDPTSIAVMDAALGCLPATDCINMSECVASALVALGQCSAEEEAADDGIACNQAAASFVLVEQYRRLLAGAGKIDAKCDRAKRLRISVAVCGNPSSGMDTLVRHVSSLIGSSDAVSDVMEVMARKRLFHGIIAIIIAFSVPGVLAIFSPPHVRMVIALQFCALFMIFYYVHSRHGTLYAIMVTMCCAGVVCAEVMLIALFNKYVGRTSSSSYHTD